MPILQPIKPQYCELIAVGKKTIEVRKARPKIKTPFKCYIYETKAQYIKSRNGACTKYGYGCGKVIGEYVCDEIVSFGFTPYNHGEYVVSFDKKGERDILKESCLTFDEMYDYIGEGHGYGWHISDLKIYDRPKELSEFYTDCKPDDKKCQKCPHYTEPDIYGLNFCSTYFEKHLTRPPQSWCYVEEV